jgi:hypothetical protein
LRQWKLFEEYRSSGISFIFRKLEEVAKLGAKPERSLVRFINFKATDCSRTSLPDVAALESTTESAEIE